MQSSRNQLEPSVYVREFAWAEGDTESGDEDAALVTDEHFLKSSPQGGVQATVPAEGPRNTSRQDMS